MPQDVNYTLDDAGKHGLVVFVRSGTHSELFSQPLKEAQNERPRKVMNLLAARVHVERRSRLDWTPIRWMGSPRAGYLMRIILADLGEGLDAARQLLAVAHGRIVPRTEFARPTLEKACTSPYD